MAVARYLNIVGGKLKQIVASVTSTADAIVAMDATGRIDVSILPVGISAEVIIAPSSENLSSGNFINLWNNGGALNARKSDYTTNAKPAHGFVLANVTSPANATVHLLSQTNTALSGLTAGTDYYGHTTAGAVSSTPPVAAGNVSQQLGTAQSTTAMTFAPGPAVEIA